MLPAVLWIRIRMDPALIWLSWIRVMYGTHCAMCSSSFVLQYTLFVSSGYPGFITKFRGTDKVPDKPDTDTVDFENYRHVCHKWHYKENSANYK